MIERGIRLGTAADEVESIGVRDRMNGHIVREAQSVHVRVAIRSVVFHVTPDQGYARVIETLNLDVALGMLSGRERVIEVENLTNALDEVRDELVQFSDRNVSRDHI